MNFLSEWFAMSGYGFYLWSAYGFFILLVLFQNIHTKKQQKRRRKSLELWFKRQKDESKS